MSLRVDNLAWLLAVPLALGLSSCSSTSTGGGDFGGGGTPNTGSTGGNTSGTTGSTTGGSGNTGANNSNTGSSATPASTGTTSGTGNKPASGSSGSGSQSGTGAGSSSGSQPGISSSGGGQGAGSSSGTGTSSGAGSSGAGAGSSGAAGSGSGGMGATGPLGRITGCGQATSCTPASDLPVPTNGVQFALPQGSVTVQPGQEAYYCFYNTLQQATTVGAFQSWMTTGSSHHFIVYEQQTASAPDGSVSQCNFGGGTWRFATSVPGQIIELKFPDTVGLQIQAGEQINMNMHFINPGSSPANPEVKLNLINAQNVQNYAAAMISFNAQISIPPASALGPGTQTVNGTCTAPSGANFFAVTTHTHKWATAAEVNLVRGGQTTNIVNTTNWEAPDVALWNGPTWLTMGPGDSFTYSCSYSNSGSTTITVGDTAANNEMCMAIGYYFPAGMAQCF